MIDFHSSALVVVDMQNDFLAKGGYYDVKQTLLNARNGILNDADFAELSALHGHPPNADVIRQGYEDLVERVHDVARTTLAKGLCTVFVCAAYDPRSNVRPPLFLSDPDRRDYSCHPGTWGAELVAPLKPLAAEANATVVTKPSFDAFHATKLCTLLSAKQITAVYLTGIETNVCVLFTALSALSNGFRTIILEDAVATSRPQLHVPAIQILEVAKAGRMSSKDFVGRLARPERFNIYD